MENGKSVFVVGTVYKEMALKPNVLEEYENEVRGQVFSDDPGRQTFVAIYLTQFNMIDIFA